MSTHRVVRWAAALACLAFMAGLFIGGAQPVAAGLLPSPWDKLAHVLAFGALAFLLELALRPAAWVFFALPLAASVADEVHQAFLPDRYASVADWLAGLVGVSLAWWLLRHTGLRRWVSAIRG